MCNKTVQSFTIERAAQCRRVVHISSTTLSSSSSRAEGHSSSRRVGERKSDLGGRC